MTHFTFHCLVAVTSQNNRPVAIVSTSPSSSQVLPCSPATSTLSSVPSSSRDSDIKIPDRWRPEVELAIEDKSLNDSARNGIVRTLVGHLFEKSTKPNRSQCEEVARKFILKYPFFKDDLGNGYVSQLFSLILWV